MLPENFRHQCHELQPAVEVREVGRREGKKAALVKSLANAVFGPNKIKQADDVRKYAKRHENHMNKAGQN